MSFFPSIAGYRAAAISLFGTFYAAVKTTLPRRPKTASIYVK
jgi:hypothetical protein